MEIEPAFAVPAQVLGDIYLKEENFTEAIRWLNRAAEKMPDDAEVLLSLSRAQAESGASSEALETLQRRRALLPPTPVFTSISLASTFVSVTNRRRKRQPPSPFDFAIPNPRSPPLPPRSDCGDDC